MYKKLFVVSDIHGHYAELMEALDNAGFDRNDESHLFISCGDLFDRGKENLQVYDFVRGLQHKILIRGNHEDMLYQALERGCITETDIWNETDITIVQMLGENAVDANGCFDLTLHTEKIGEITAFIDSMLNYYETAKYVFTHGWLPITFEGRYPQIDKAWRSASSSDWKVSHLLEWQQLYDVGAMLEGKTIVCGHRPALLGHMFDSSREPDSSDPFYGEGIIAIDAGTVRSGRVNVLVIEELGF